jgi:ribosomal-protein-serine acetyltransferase
LNGQSSTLGTLVLLMTATSAIAIRPYRSSDVREVYEAAMESVQRVQRFMPWCHAELTEVELREWIEAQIAAFQARSAFEFAIVDAGRFVGGCGLNKIDTDDRRANVAYWVRTSAAQQGIATAAIRHVVQWAWDNTELARLELVVSTTNLPSLRTAERAGAQREGVLRQRLLLHGVMHDAVMFSFVRESNQSR